MKVPRACKLGKTGCSLSWLWDEKKFSEFLSLPMGANRLLSLKYCVQECLTEALEQFWQTWRQQDVSGGMTLPTEMGLSFAKHPTRLGYRCAAGLQWAKLLQQSAMDISSQLANVLGVGSTKATVLEMSGVEFLVEVVSPGWIEFQLTEAGLVIWLQHLTCGSSFRLYSPLNRLHDTQDILAVQYAHARCCALLRLADQEGLIQLKALPTVLSVPVLQCLEPISFPWLDELGQLRLREPVECRLIRELVIGVDAVADWQNLPVGRLKKQAIALSSAFEDFYRLCRIWGEVKRETPQLAQARLGLVLATQTVLRVLLQEGLGMDAPAEF